MQDLSIWGYWDRRTSVGHSTQLVWMFVDGLLEVGELTDTDHND